MQIQEFKLKMGEKFSLDLIFIDNFCPMSDGPFQNIHVLTMFRYVPAALPLSTKLLKISPEIPISKNF